jgi:hypothetical protein
MTRVWCGGALLVLIACSAFACDSDPGVREPSGSTTASPAPAGATAASIPSGLVAAAATPSQPWGPHLVVGSQPGPQPIPKDDSVLSVASTWEALTSGHTATTFDHTTTSDILVRAKLSPRYAGKQVGLNFVSPNGGVLAGYVGKIEPDGNADFDVKLAGTFVGRNKQTGTFQLVLGDVRAQSDIAMQVITLTNGGAR